MKRQTKEQVKNKKKLKYNQHLTIKPIVVPKILLIRTTRYRRKSSENSLKQVILRVAKLVKDAALTYNKVLELIKKAQYENSKYSDIKNLDNFSITLSKIEHKLLKHPSTNDKLAREEDKYELTIAMTNKKVEEEEYQTANEHRLLLQSEICKLKVTINKYNENLHCVSASIENIKNLLQKNKEISEAELMNIKSLRETHKSLLVRYNEAKIEHKNLIKADIMREYVIHRIKGKLYTILVSNYDTKELINTPLHSLDIPFDTIVDTHSDLYEDCIKHWLEITRPMILSCLGVLKGLIKDLTYFVISANNQYRLLVDYILGCIKNMVEYSIEGQLLDQVQGSVKNLKTMSEMREFIMCSTTFHKLITISLNGIKILFVLINANRSEDLEFINAKTHIKGSYSKRSNLLRIFNSVHVGYLVLLLDIKVEDILHVNKIIEQAKSIVDYVKTDKFTYLISK